MAEGYVHQPADLRAALLDVYRGLHPDRSGGWTLAALADHGFVAIQHIQTANNLHFDIPYVADCVLSAVADLHEMDLQSAGARAHRSGFRIIDGGLRG